MNVWFIIILIINCLGLGISLAKHGESKKDSNYNFLIELIGVVINITLIVLAIKQGF